MLGFLAAYMPSKGLVVDLESHSLCVGELLSVNLTMKEGLTSMIFHMHYVQWHACYSETLRAYSHNPSPCSGQPQSIVPIFPLWYPCSDLWIVECEIGL